MRILKDKFEFRDLVAHVLTFDYLGALGASLLFPLWLVPHLGLVRGAIFFGILNAGVALWTTYLFEDRIGAVLRLRVISLLVIAALAVGLAYSTQILDLADSNLYADEVIFARNTR